MFLFLFRNYSFAYRSVQEAPAIYPDRVVTIRGTVDNMSAAEAVISSKLRECHERDVQNPNVSSLRGDKGGRGG